MATVYLAHDLRHDRPVALKVLLPDLTAVLGSDRFLREIQLTATLQHPHILPLYDSGEAGGLLYYVVPYVEGGSLRNLLLRERQLPLEEALTLIRTVAGALEYAHRRGVIHRDIKPENILIQQGQPLLADFGIALAVRKAGGDRLTETGLSLGTPQYMSPEQATGDRGLGPQSDIYSLAAVAYELLVGEPPITGPTGEAVLARVVLESPRPIRTVRASVPAGVEAAILKALSKVPADRFRTADEFAAALDVSAAPAISRRGIKASIRSAGLALAAIAAVGLIVFLSRSFPDAARSPPPVRRQLTFSGKALLAAISPDGKFLAYTVQADTVEHLLVQELDGGAPDTIDTRLGHNNLEWSPDGSRLLFGFRDRAFVVPRTGGPARSIVSPPPGTGVLPSWLPDGSRISLHTSNDKRVLVVNLETEDTTAIPVRGNYWTLDEVSWSPNGRVFAMSTGSRDPMSYAIRAVTLDGRTELIVEDSVGVGSPRWSPDGQNLYYTRYDFFGDASIWRVQIFPKTGRRRGVPEEVHKQLEVLPVGAGFVFFSVTQDLRRMVYARGTRFSNLWRVEGGTAGQPRRSNAITSGTALRWSPAVSPDGRWVAFAQKTGGLAELFRMPVEGGSASQITFDARVWPASQIAWSPDGKQIAYESLRARRPQVWIAHVDDGRYQPLSRTQMSPYSGHLAWAPSSQIAYQRYDRRNIILLDPVSGKERLLVADSGRGAVFSPQYAPGGNRLAAYWYRDADDRGVWVFELQTGSYVKVAQGPLFPLGWSEEGRYIYAQGPGSSVHRIDSGRKSPPHLVLNAPFREAECTPVRQGNTFVCAAFDFISDVWMIENFDSPDS
jgi:serine/threonine protein kinase